MIKLNSHEKEIMAIAKSSLGITSSVMDERLGLLTRAAIEELASNYKVVLNPASVAHSVFVADWVEWRYLNRDNNVGMPRHLDYRLKTLFLKGLVKRREVRKQQ